MSDSSARALGHYIFFLFHPCRSWRSRFVSSALFPTHLNCIILCCDLFHWLTYPGDAFLAQMWSLKCQQEFSTAPFTTLWHFCILFFPILTFHKFISSAFVRTNQFSLKGKSAYHRATTFFLILFLQRSTEVWRSLFKIIFTLWVSDRGQWIIHGNIIFANYFAISFSFSAFFFFTYSLEDSPQPLTILV